MIRVRSYAAVSLFLVTTAATYAPQNTLQTQVLAKERQELDCLRNGNYAEFASLLADDAVFVDTHAPRANRRSLMIPRSSGSTTTPWTT